MVNFFDQFDDRGTTNPFDQFDTPSGQDSGPARAALQGFNSTIPFGNRITAGVGAGLASLSTGENISDLYNMARENQLATSEANPAAELAGSLAGIVPMLPIGLSKSIATTPILGKAANVLSGSASKIGNFVGGGEAAAGAGKLARAGNVALRSAKAGAVAAPVGALYNYGGSPNDLRSPEAMEDAATGARIAGGVAAALPLAGGIAGATLAAAAPKISEWLGDVAKLARQYNIPLSLDQVSNSRALKNIQKVSQELPLSGQSAFRERQMLQLQKELFKTAGVDARLFTPKTMSAAFNKVGGEFDAITKGKSFNIGGNFINDLAETADNVASTYGSNASEIYQKEALRVINDFSSGDNITGELISRQRARINALARNSPDQNIKGALLDLENNIIDAITSGDPALQKALTTAKQRYKNLIVLEPIANKAKGGFISPSLLNSRVSQVYKRAHTIGESGDIGNLARIGHELLPELGGSDTTQKLGTAGAILTGYANPTAIPGMLGAVGANRAFQAGINRNQRVIDRALMKQIRSLPPAEAKKLLEKGTP